MNTIIYRKKSAFLFSSLLISIVCFCQENYQKGYIILNNGDTLHGYIDNRDWGSNPSQVAFKESLSADKMIFSPVNSKGFGVPDENYVSAIIETETSSIFTADLENTPDLKITVDTTFLKVLFSGDKSLYMFKGVADKEQFYIAKDSKYELLVYKRYISQNQNSANFNSDVVAENKRYTGQLMLYLNDCPSITSKLNDVKYTRKSLESLFHYYYKSTGKKLDFKKEAEKITLDAGLLAGMSIYPENDSKTEGGSTENIKSSADLNFGVYFDFVFPRNQKKWSIHNEILYSPYHKDGTYLDYTNSSEYLITDSKKIEKLFEMNNMIRFQYPVGKVSLFVNLGLSAALGKEKITYERIEKQYHSINTITESYPNTTSIVNNIGFNYGLGVKFCRFTAEARLESMDGYSRIPLINSNYYRYFFTLGYRFY